MSGSSELFCTLTLSEQRVRRARVRTEIVEQIINVYEVENGLQLEFRFSKKLLKQLEEFILLEQGCCGFLRFAISQKSTHLNLLIEGPPAAAQVIDMIRNTIEGELM